MKNNKHKITSGQVKMLTSFKRRIFNKKIKGQKVSWPQKVVGYLQFLVTGQQGQLPPRPTPRRKGITGAEAPTPPPTVAFVFSFMAGGGWNSLRFGNFLVVRLASKSTKHVNPLINCQGSELGRSSRAFLPKGGKRKTEKQKLNTCFPMSSIEKM